MKATLLVVSCALAVRVSTAAAQPLPLPPTPKPFSGINAAIAAGRCAWRQVGPAGQRAAEAAEVRDGDRGLVTEISRSPAWRTSLSSCGFDVRLSNRLAYLAVLGLTMQLASTELLTQNHVNAAYLREAWRRAPLATRDAARETARKLVARQPHGPADVDWSPVYQTLGLALQPTVAPRSSQFYTTIYCLGAALPEVAAIVSATISVSHMTPSA